jgi:hypothetical protein
MNRLPIARRLAMLEMLLGGSGIRATRQQVGVSINTVAKLLAELGSGCAEYHDRKILNLRLRRLNFDDVWSFYMTEGRSSKQESRPKSEGSIWTWFALDADSKLCVSYLVGGRNGWWAGEFINDCVRRVVGRIRVTAEGQKVYLDVAENGFGADVDYARLQRVLGAVGENETRRSPERCSDRVTKHLGMGVVERQSPVTRIGSRRFTRPAAGSSKRIEAYAASVAIHVTYYNFARIHKIPGVTPAMAAGLADHVWSLEEMLLLAS